MTHAPPAFYLIFGVFSVFGTFYFLSDLLQILLLCTFILANERSIRYTKWRANLCYAITCSLLRRAPRTSLEPKNRTVRTAQIRNGKLFIALCASFENTVFGCGATGNALPWGGSVRLYFRCKDAFRFKSRFSTG